MSTVQTPFNSVQSPELSLSPEIASGETPVNSIDLPVPKSIRPHLAYLDGLRGLAAMFVVVHHSYLWVWNVFDGGKLPSGIANALTSWLVYGHFAVSLFIVLSGYCLMLPVAKNKGQMKTSAKTFFARRFRRIVPTYYWAIVVSLCLNFLTERLLKAEITSVSFPNLLTHFLLIHNLFPDYFTGVNGAMWSIGVEFQIYFLFPVFVWAAARYGIERVAGIALLVTTPLSLALQSTPLKGATVHYIGLFAVGMLGAAITHGSDPRLTKLRDRPFWSPLFVGSCALLVSLCHLWGWQGLVNPPVVLYDFVWVGVALPLLVLLAQPDSGRPNPFSRFRSLLSLKLLASVGTYSYSLYLLHLPVSFLVLCAIVRPLHLPAFATFPVLIALGFPACLLTAWTFYQVCEKRFLPK